MDAELLARFYVGVGLRHIAAVGVAACAAGAHGDASVGADAEADAAADALVGAVLIGRALRCQQVDLVVGLKRNVVVRFDAAALNAKVAVLPRARGGHAGASEKKRQKQDSHGKCRPINKTRGVISFARLCGGGSTLHQFFENSSGFGGHPMLLTN